MNANIYEDDNVTFIIIPCPDDTMGDTSPSECEAYREWFADQLAAEYPCAHIVVTSRPGSIEVGTSDDADEEPIIERLREFSNACWERCKWDFLDEYPTPDEIRAAREAAGLTQTQSAINRFAE